MECEDASGFSGTAEKLLVPATEAELTAILREANESAIPVTLYGAGSGVTGGSVPQGGWRVSMEKFRRLEVTSGEARVGAGVLLKELQAAARSHRQFYGPDPTHDAAAMGGMLANNASGSRSFRFGSTRDHVLALRVAFIDGTIAEFHRGQAIDFGVPALRRPQTTKHQAGYALRPGMDWIDLLIGSEGTLCVFIECTVRLFPAPGPLLSGVVFFPSEDTQLAAVAAWRSVPGLRMLESFDEASLRLLRDAMPDLPEAAGGLIIEQENASAEEWIDRLETAGALLEDSWFGESETDRERFRRFRHALPETVNATVRRNGYMKMGTDYAVPPQRTEEIVKLYRAGLATFPGQAVIYGHIGDGHLHVNLMPRDEAERVRAEELIGEFARAAVSLGGTVGAEHGLGKRKRYLLKLLYSAGEIEAMQAVKRRLDPQWLLGRETLFPVPLQT